MNLSKLFFCFFASSLSALTPIIILIGPPGSGKGTCSQYLKERYDYQHVSIGDLLRKEVAMQTELGCQIEETIKRGDFIDPSIVHFLLAQSVLDIKTEQEPLILDGFARNADDVPFMQNLFKTLCFMPRTFILHLTATDATCLERIAYRSVCTNCGHVYHKLWAQPIDGSHCDLCGQLVQARMNDTEAVTLKRLRHHRNTIESYYEKALDAFPAIVFDASGPLEDCLSFYDHLALTLASSSADSSDFVEEFQIKNF